MDVQHFFGVHLLLSIQGILILAGVGTCSHTPFSNKESSRNFIGCFPCFQKYLVKSCSKEHGRFNSDFRELFYEEFCSLKPYGISKLLSQVCKVVAVERLPSGVFADPFELQHLVQCGGFAFSSLSLEEASLSSLVLMESCCQNDSFFKLKNDEEPVVFYVFHPAFAYTNLSKTVTFKSLLSLMPRAVAFQDEAPFFAAVKENVSSPPKRQRKNKAINAAIDQGKGMNHMCLLLKR